MRASASDFISPQSEEDAEEVDGIVSSFQATTKCKKLSVTGTMMEIVTRSATKALE